MRAPAGQICRSICDLILQLAALLLKCPDQPAAFAQGGGETGNQVVEGNHHQDAHQEKYQCPGDPSRWLSSGGVLGNNQRPGRKDQTKACHGHGDQDQGKNADPASPKDPRQKGHGQQKELSTSPYPILEQLRES